MSAWNELPWLREAQAFMFDCYGTLIDWDRGIHETLAPLMARHGVTPSETELLARFDLLERSATAGGYIPYREVLGRVLDTLGSDWGFQPSREERACIAQGIGAWKPYMDTRPTLERLARHTRLAVVSNIDDDLFSETRSQLGVNLDVVVTAQMARSYKPRHAHFHLALERLGLSPGAVVHVAASVHHDIVPAHALGMRTVWISRRRLGARQTDPLSADLVLKSLKNLI